MRRETIRQSMHVAEEDDDDWEAKYFAVLINISMYGNNFHFVFSKQLLRGHCVHSLILAT